MKSCLWCGTKFEYKVSYQVYCSTDCRKLAAATKAREHSRSQLIKKRSRRQRMCANGCGTSLSVYNDGKICSKCRTNNKMVERALKGIEALFEWEDDT